LNILVLTPLIPYPPHDGDKLRLYHFLKHLKSRGHQIDLFCLSRVKSDFSYEEDLRPLCRRTYVEHLGNSDLFFNLVGGVLIGQSLNVSSYFSPELRNRLKDYWQTSEGQAIDVVLAHRLRMAPAAFEYNPGKPVVLELTDCLTAYARQLKGKNVASFSRRLAAWWDYWFLRREEVEWTERAFQSTIISESDAQVLREQGAPVDHVTVIPNGVEFKRVSKAKKSVVYPKGKPVVCFVGNMGYAANEDGALWFLKKVWPRIKKQAPSAVFAAVGGYPREALQRHHNGRDVLVTGWVPQIEPYLVQANLSIAPLRVAAGMQNKVALSLALGVPVVATPQAVSWMPLKGRDGVIVVGNEDQFVQEVVEVLLRPKAAKAWAKKGQRFILKNYRWNDSGKKLEQVLKQAVKSNS
jgi:glycosyltransferase involved in cell wall biosynthesis